MTDETTRLRDAREAAGMTLRTAASHLHIDFTYLSKVENGHERPSDALLSRMGEVYGFDGPDAVLARTVAEVPDDVRRAIAAEARAGLVSVEAVREAAHWLERSQREQNVHQFRHGMALLRAALAGPTPSPAVERLDVQEVLDVLGSHEGNGCCDPKTLEHVAQDIHGLADAADILAALAATPPAPQHEHDFRVWNNQADPARRVCQNQPCPGGFNPDPDKPATPPAPAVERPDPERLLDAIEAQAIGEVEA